MSALNSKIHKASQKPQLEQCPFGCASGLQSLLFVRRGRPHRRVARPQWAIGDSWTYVDTSYPTIFYPGSVTTSFTLKVLAVTDSYYSVQNSTLGPEGKEQRSTQRWSIQTNRLSRIDGAANRWQEFLRYKWPLIKGESWEAPYYSSSGDTLWEVNVGDWEMVTVPAGEFRAIRVKLSRTGFWQGYPGTKSEVLWYAPAVKRHIRLEARTFVRSAVVEFRVQELTASSSTKGGV